MRALAVSTSAPSSRPAWRGETAPDTVGGVLLPRRRPPRAPYLRLPRVLHPIPFYHSVDCRQACRRRCLTTVSAAKSLPAAPLLVPEGPWEVLPGGGVTTPRGFLAAGISAGLRSVSDRADYGLVVLAPVDGSSGPPGPGRPPDAAPAAGCFTRNRVCAAPVTLCREVLDASPVASAVLVNAACANAATGDQGMADARATREAVASRLGCEAGRVLVMSTGVIGKRLKVDKMTSAAGALVDALGSTEAHGLAFAGAMCTTDLVTKSAALRVRLPGSGVEVAVGGCCKGSGMIHPDMATMLGTMTTDAAVDPEVLRGMCRRSIRDSFNQISVDGDTSTNDTVVALASGAAGNPIVDSADSADGAALEAAFTALAAGLAKAIAWDGEGATALIEVRCTGAASDDDARRVAKSVVCSNLTKAAVFGKDPNWGRIACAAGYSGVDFDASTLSIRLGDVDLMRDGQPLPFDQAAASGYLEERTAAHGTVTIDVGVGEGRGRGTAWGCDLSYEYVRINAEYTT